MPQDVALNGWKSLLRREWLPTLAILLGGVLLQSMNVLMVTTVLPSIVLELGGVAVLNWPTTAYLACSIVAASCAGVLASVIGPRAVYCVGVATFALGALFCSLAQSMGWIVAGRLIQGFGGGLEAAVAYVVLRETFPESVWSRAVALMSTSWSVSVLLGPLVGGLFARFGDWRGAFVTAAVAALVLMVGAFFTLPSAISKRQASRLGVPAGRVALICLAIAAVSFASVVASQLAKVALIALAIAALAAMLRLDRAASRRLLPSDAFSWSTPTGVALWLVLLLSITFSPLQIYVPLFLQQLHGLDPLTAGLVVAMASLAWSTGSIATAGASPSRADRLMSIGPVTMAASLIALAVLLPHAAVVWLIPAIALLGAGIGQCWPFVAQRVMAGAKEGDETVAASSVPTVQQIGVALGAATAGVIANASGLSGALNEEGVASAAFWLPASFVVPALLALYASRLLSRLSVRR